MADAKISALDNLTSADPANDMIPIVDVSATPPASGNTKRISINNLLACSPSATLASATITGNLTVDTNTLFVDSSANVVGIGTITPQQNLHVLGTGTTTIAVERSGATIAGRFEFVSGNSTNLVRCVTAKDLVFEQTLGTEVHRIAANGVATWSNVGGVAGTGLTLNATSNLVLRGGTAGANGVGLTFPATQVASSDANCLDDYEEGTWTGTLTGSTSNPTIPVTATGRYTKIGRVVSVQLTFENISNVGAVGSIGISGLPFTTNASVASTGTSSLYGMGTYTGSPFIYLDTNTTSVIYYANVSSSNFSSVTHNAGTGRYATMSATYTI